MKGNSLPRTGYVRNRDIDTSERGEGAMRFSKVNPNLTSAVTR
jgi:hypothetical protein